MGKPRKAETRKPRYGKGSNFKGKKGRSGAPKGNANAQRHGLRGSKLPKGCQYIENAVNNLRRQVESAVIAKHGRTNVVSAAAINSILKWERHGMLAAHWLRKEGEKLSVSERLQFSREIATASDNRDRALRSLELDVETADEWSALNITNYADQPAADDGTNSKESA